MANRTFSGYIGGQLMDALLVGVETFVLMSLFRLDYVPLIAVLVGVTNIIPVLDPLSGCARHHHSAAGIPAAGGGVCSDHSGGPAGGR